MFIKLSINDTKAGIEILIKYNIAVAFPAIFLKKDMPRPIESGRIEPQLKNIIALINTINVILIEYI